MPLARIDIMELELMAENRHHSGSAAASGARTSPAPRRRRLPTTDPVALGLRSLWRNAEQEALPDDFLDLLDQIDAAAGTQTPAAAPTNDRSSGSHDQ